MMRILKSKKGFDFKTYVKWGAIVIGFVIVLGIWSPLQASIKKGGLEITNGTLDFDNDGVKNMYDKCCSVNCTVLPHEWPTFNDDPDSPKRGCAADQVVEAGICTTNPAYPCKRSPPASGTNN